MASEKEFGDIWAEYMYVYREMKDSGCYCGIFLKYRCKIYTL